MLNYKSHEKNVSYSTTEEFFREVLPDLKYHRSPILGVYVIVNVNIETPPLLGYAGHRLILPTNVILGYTLCLILYRFRGGQANGCQLFYPMLGWLLPTTGD